MPQLVLDQPVITKMPRLVLDEPVIRTPRLVPDTEPTEKPPLLTGELVPATYRRLGVTEWRPSSWQDPDLQELIRVGKVQRPEGKIETVATKPQFITTPADIRPSIKPVTLTEKLGLPEIPDFGLPEVVRATKELISPPNEYMKRESEEASKEWYDRLSWWKTYLLSLGGRIGPKGLRQELTETAEKFHGFGPALMPMAGGAATNALEWGVIYPELFKAVGVAGETISQIPKVQKAAKAIESIGGIERFAQKYPKLYVAGQRALTSFVKGEAVGQTMAAAESFGKDKSFEEWVSDMNKRGAVLGGVATVFSIANSYDQYRYVTKVSGLMRQAAYNRFQQRVQAGIDPKTAGQLSEIEARKIEDITAYLESEMLGQEQTLYGGKKPELSAREAANQFVTNGFVLGTEEAGKLAAIRKPQAWFDMELNRAKRMMSSGNPKTRQKGQDVYDWLQKLQRKPSGIVPEPETLETKTRPITEIPVKGKLPVSMTRAYETVKAEEQLRQGEDRLQQEIDRMDAEVAEIQRTALSEAQKKAEGISVTPQTTETQPRVEPEALTKAIEAEQQKTEGRGQKAEIQRMIAEPTEAKGGRKERNRAIRETEEKILQHPIYQMEVEALGTQRREIDVGFYYVPAKFRSEVENIIGTPKVKNRPNALQKMFTFDPSDLNRGAVDWERAVQQATTRAPVERQYETGAEMDITEFVQRVKDAQENQANFGRINTKAIEKAEESGDPYLKMQAEKLRMIKAGHSPDEIDAMVEDYAREYGLGPEEITEDLYGEHAIKMQEIARIEDEKQAEQAMSQLAERETGEELRNRAEQSAKEVLDQYGLNVEIEQVEEIETPDKGILGQEGRRQKAEEIPFERRGTPDKGVLGRVTGAAISQGGKETILLAYGADSETGYHEAYHTLRRRLSTNDIKILNNRFGGDQEAEARGFVDYVKTNKAPATILRHIWNKLKAILAKVKSALQGKGFKTAEDIFGEIRRGELKTEGRGQKAGVQYETREEILRREAEWQAVHDAKLAKAKAERVRIRQGKRLRGGMNIKLMDTTPPLREDLAPEQKVKVKKPTEAELRAEEKAKPIVRNIINEKWYKENRERIKRSWREAIGDVSDLLWLEFDRATAAMSDRLDKINVRLKYMVRRYVFNYQTRTVDMSERCVPLIKKARKVMTKTDKRDFDNAHWNSDEQKQEELVRKYHLEKENEQVRTVLDELYDGDQKVGIEEDYRRAYWPNVIKNMKGLLRYLRGTEDWSIVEQALNKRQEQAGGRELTEDEQAQVIATLFRGFRIGGVMLSRPGYSLERRMDILDKNISQFYYNPDEALFIRIEKGNRAIAAREFFGKQTREITNKKAQISGIRTRLSKLSRRQGRLGIPEEKYKEHISTAWKKLNELTEEVKEKQNQKVEDSIGYYLKDLVINKEISPTQEKEVYDMFVAIFEPRGMNQILRLFTKIEYIDTLANSRVALTQLQEYGLSFYESKWRFLPAALKAATGQSKIKVRDLGVTNVDEYMRALGFGKLANGMMIQLMILDEQGKQTKINTTLSHYRAEAERPHLRAEFLNKMRNIFAKEANEVIDDLRNDRVTDNIKFLASCELADVQPLWITETPEYYARGGNGRILYLLKTFTVRQLSFIRRECLRDMAHPIQHPLRFVKGFTRLVHLMGILVAFGVGKDFLRKWFTGQPFTVDDFKDSVVENLLQYATFGLLSRYTMYRAKEEGIGTAVLKGLLPPVKFIDALWKDMSAGKIRELPRSIPLIGEPYYWWFGYGAEKEAKRQQKGRSKGF